MATRFSSEAIVETVVTLAAAALLTLAGFEMLEGVDAADVVPVIAMPHVDAAT
jgi:hypothetical protein